MRTSDPVGDSVVIHCHWLLTSRSMKNLGIVAIVFTVIVAVITAVYVSYNSVGTQQTLPITPGVTTTTPDTNRTVIVIPEENITVREQRDIVAYTDAAVAELRDKKFAAFASRIHPTKGILVEPYQYVSTSTGVHFAQSKNFVAQMASTSTRLWGHADGLGSPIAMSFSKFYSEWLFDHDYLEAPTVRVFRSYSNIPEVFPDAHVVLYEYPGFDQELGGMDWSGLVLGIEEYEGEWYVVVLAHAQWMI